MIYNCENNQTVRIVDFGHGDLAIGLACEEGSQINNRYAIMPATYNPVGESRPDMVGTRVENVDDSIVLTFAGPEALRSLDVLIEDLEEIRKNIRNRDDDK